MRPLKSPILQNPSRQTITKLHKLKELIPKKKKEKKKKKSSSRKKIAKTYVREGAKTKLEGKKSERLLACN